MDRKHNVFLVFIWDTCPVSYLFDLSRNLWSNKLGLSLPLEKIEPSGTPKRLNIELKLNYLSLHTKTKENQGCSSLKKNWYPWTSVVHSNTIWWHTMRSQWRFVCSVCVLHEHVADAVVFSISFFVNLLIAIFTNNIISFIFTFSQKFKVLFM